MPRKRTRVTPFSTQGDGEVGVRIRKRADRSSNLSKAGRFGAVFKRDRADNKNYVELISQDFEEIKKIPNNSYVNKIDELNSDRKYIYNGVMDRLKEYKPFIDHVSSNQWNKRQQRGLPWKMDVFDFIREVYGSWIKLGMVRSDLRALDKPLVNRLEQALQERELPEDIYFPTEAKAALLKIGDPEKQKERLIIREFERVKKAESTARAKGRSAICVEQLDAEKVEIIKKYHRDRTERYWRKRLK